MAEDVTTTERGDVLALTAEIVSAYVGNNSVPQTAVADLIRSTFETLAELASDKSEVSVELTPAVPIKKSITDDYLICLEDGKKLKMLKRYLMSNYNMTPEDYRVKWGLKADYPMVAPSYALRRRDLAVKIGLGRKRKEPKPVKGPAKPGTKVAAKPMTKAAAKPRPRRKAG